MAGSVRFTLSCSAANVTGSVGIARAAAGSDGRRPRDTSVTNSTTVENNRSREYWRSRCWSNTSSTPLDALAPGQPAGNARSSAVRAITLAGAVRAITLAGACCSNRSKTVVQMLPLLSARQIRTQHLGLIQRP